MSLQPKGLPEIPAQTVAVARADRGLTPGEHYLDAGYPSADLIHDAAARGITMVTLALRDHSPQAKADAGFQKSAFRIDWKARQVRCPQGRTSTGWFPARQHGRDAIVVQFARADCHACPAQDKCTTSARGTRILSLRPRELHETLTGARAEQASKTWKTKYALRAGIEGTINQALDVTGLRRPATAACPRSASNMPSPPPLSTSSASTPTGTPANRPSRPGPADSPASVTNSQPEPRRV
ncbi:transposase [Streptomyces sp. NPDC052042]|uniref:transposase n=1 Tax=Streptomyces sp. NPDC052042 TaxID=3365683 RepID=UPI0037D616B5